MSVNNLYEYILIYDSVKFMYFLLINILKQLCIKYISDVLH